MATAGDTLTLTLAPWFIKMNAAAARCIGAISRASPTTAQFMFNGYVAALPFFIRKAARFSIS